MAKKKPSLSLVTKLKRLTAEDIIEALLDAKIIDQHGSLYKKFSSVLESLNTTNLLKVPNEPEESNTSTGNSYLDSLERSRLRALEIMRQGARNRQHGEI